MSSAAAAHGSVLLGLFFAVKAWSYGLDRFLLLYGDNGVVVGAGYTDIHVELPVLWVLVGLACAAALASLANVRVRTYKLPLAAAVLVFGSSFVLALAVPGAVPTRLCEAERIAVGGALPPAQHRPHPEAYNLRQITVKPFPCGTGPHLPVAPGQPRDHRQHPAVGLAAVDGHLRSTAGDPDLLQVP